MCCASRDRDSDEPSQSVNLGTRCVYTCVGAECGRGGSGGMGNNTSVKAQMNQ